MNRMLDKRAQILLKTLIERYIAEGQPVGSRTLSKYSGLDLSPATIRNVMSDLEDMGLIASPHTSAGRVPTPLGYRFFVDTLLIVKQLDTGELQQLETELHPDNPQRVVTAASQLLSQLTQFAGVVMTPRRRALTFRHIEFLRLSEKRILLSVQELSQDVTRLKQLFELFERKSSLIQILDLSLRGQGVQIFIGGESGVSAPDDVSVVSSPYKVDGEVVGTVGVIGPTRMAYDRVIPIVDITARLLSSALSQH